MKSVITYYLFTNTNSLNTCLHKYYAIMSNGNNLDTATYIKFLDMNSIYIEVIKVIVGLGSLYRDLCT